VVLDLLAVFVDEILLICSDRSVKATLIHLGFTEIFQKC